MYSRGVLLEELARNTSDPQREGHSVGLGFTPSTDMLRVYEKIPKDINGMAVNQYIIIWSRSGR
jgi:hypothetical protein